MTFPEDYHKLYHYTTPAGLVGVLNSQSLWMTNIHYQNDIEEYNYAFKLTQKVLDKDYPGVPYASTSIPEEISKVYTLSLTEKNDLLSQWRGYCPHGGFSYSFKNDVLEKTIQAHELELVECIYDEDVQKEYIIKHIIGISPQDWAVLRTQPESYQHYGVTRAWRAMGMGIAQHAARFKHPAFDAEKEWRLVKTFRSGIDDETLINFRAGKDLLIPYLTIPLVTDGKKYPLASVKVGPGPRQDLAKQSCKLFLQSDGVSESNIPYRNW